MVADDEAMAVTNERSAMLFCYNSVAFLYREIIWVICETTCCCEWADTCDM